jgi:hypothetical protein
MSTRIYYLGAMSFPGGNVTEAFRFGNGKGASFCTLHKGGALIAFLR